MLDANDDLEAEYHRSITIVAVLLLLNDVLCLLPLLLPLDLLIGDVDDVGLKQKQQKTKMFGVGVKRNNKKQIQCLELESKETHTKTKRLLLWVVAAAGHAMGRRIHDAELFVELGLVFVLFVVWLFGCFVMFIV